jgi:hypothetical protein
MNTKRNILFAAIAFVAGGAWTSGVHAASDNTQALSRSSYRVFYGDVNHDGTVDMLLTATPKIIAVPADDDLQIIAVPAPGSTFIVVSNKWLRFKLIADPPVEQIQSDVWRSKAVTPIFGDLQGNGIAAMLIKANEAGAPSFTITVSADSVPHLLQVLDSASIGVDLGAPGTSTEFADANHDGRSDLIVKVNGVVTATLLADANGILSKEAPPPASPPAPVPRDPPPSSPPGSPPPPPPTVPPPPSRPPAVTVQFFQERNTIFDCQGAYTVKWIGWTGEPPRNISWGVVWELTQGATYNIEVEFLFSSPATRGCTLPVPYYVDGRGKHPLSLGRGAIQPQ